MSESRAAFIALVQSHTASFAEACRRFLISRKTGYKWLHRAKTGQGSLDDQSRRPSNSPARTVADIEQRVLAVRAEYGWGARKIHAFLRGSLPTLPSPRTITAILQRHGCLKSSPLPNPLPLRRFQREHPNQLWQLDFKGPLEFQRQKFHLCNVLDDHSRFAMASELVSDKSMSTAWNVLWQLFGEVGLPQAILCDNAFAAVGKTGLSWFDSRLIRLGIRPMHGRPYHPQTQGKIERWHGTLEAEIFPRIRWSSPEEFQADLKRWRVEVYNALRPHEALEDQTPVTRWQPSPRRRPTQLPSIEYAHGSSLRKVMQKGEISWRNCEILVGAGIAGEWVRVEEAMGRVRGFYADHQIRDLSVDQLRKRAIV